MKKQLRGVTYAFFAIVLLVLCMAATMTFYTLAFRHAAPEASTAALAAVVAAVFVALYAISAVIHAKACRGIGGLLCNLLVPLSVLNSALLPVCAGRVGLYGIGIAAVLAIGAVAIPGLPAPPFAQRLAAGVVGAETDGGAAESDADPVEPNDAHGGKQRLHVAWVVFFAGLFAVSTVNLFAQGIVRAHRYTYADTELHYAESWVTAEEMATFSALDGKAWYALPTEGQIDLLQALADREAEKLGIRSVEIDAALVEGDADGYDAAYAVVEAVYLAYAQTKVELATYLAASRDTAAYADLCDLADSTRDSAARLAARAEKYADLVVCEYRRKIGAYKLNSGRTLY